MRLKTQHHHEAGHENGGGFHRSFLSTFTGGIVVGLFLCLQLVRNPVSWRPSSMLPMNQIVIDAGNLTTVMTETAHPPRFLVPDESRKKWMAAISGANETDCATVFEKMRKQEWEDPNHEMFMYRRIKTAPHFLVSVHHQEYDPVRYNAIYKSGNYYEGDVIRRFEQILGENRDAFDYNSTSAMPLVIDIGGNIGFYTLLSAAWNHAVLTFEINPANIIRICESLHLNSRNDYGFSELSHSMAVMIHQQGISDVTGSTFRVEVHRNPGQTALENAPKGADSGATTKRVFTTTTVTLDDFAEERGWFSRTDFSVSILKIDTEGHELQIVKGAKRFIQSQLAKNILLEYRKHCREAMNILFDAGYVLVDGKPSVSLSKDESIKSLDEQTEKLKNGKTGDPYADLWFRLDSLPL